VRCHLAGRLLAAVLALVAAPAGAQPSSGGWRLTYSGYADGLNVLGLTVDFRFSAAGYAIAMRGRTDGLIRLMYHADWQTISVGLWTSTGIAPGRYDNEGHFGCQYRHVSLAFDASGPEVRLLVPPDDGETVPVSPGDVAGAVDSLGAMALSLRGAGPAACRGAIKTFDGRRVEDVTLHAAPPEMMPPTSRSIWHGEAQRCDFIARLVAGFPRDGDAAAAAPHNEAVWLAPPLPGAPALPVRMTLYNRHLGQVALYLTGAKPIADTATVAR
jgi:hypothetical protein